MSTQSRHLADLVSEKLLQVFLLHPDSEYLSEWRPSIGRLSASLSFARRPIRTTMQLGRTKKGRSIVIDYSEIWKNT